MYVFTWFVCFLSGLSCAAFGGDPAGLAGKVFFVGDNSLLKVDGKIVRVVSTTSGKSRSIELPECVLGVVSIGQNGTCVLEFADASPVLLDCNELKQIRFGWLDENSHRCNMILDLGDRIALFSDRNRGTFDLGEKVLHPLHARNLGIFSKARLAEAVMSESELLADANIDIGSIAGRPIGGKQLSDGKFRVAFESMDLDSLLFRWNIVDFIAEEFSVNAKLSLDFGPLD